MANLYRNLLSPSNAELIESISKMRRNQSLDQLSLGNLKLKPTNLSTKHNDLGQTLTHDKGFFQTTMGKPVLP